MNKDNRPHVLTVLGAAHPQRLHVLPGAQLENLCPSGCIVRMDGKTENDYRIEGNEHISIEDGTLYYDGELLKKDGQATQNTSTRDATGKK